MLVSEIKTETVEKDFKDLPCRDFDWDCLATDGIIPFGDYRKCQNYDRITRANAFIHRQMLKDKKTAR